jgi:hypothetical protein
MAACERRGLQRHRCNRRYPRQTIRATGRRQANHIVLVVKDKDGNDTNGVGDFGGDEYHYNLPLTMFNTSTMTTVSVPLAAFTKLQAFEFQHPGDGLLSNFNLYYLGINTDPGVGQVNMAIESVRVNSVRPPVVRLRPIVRVCERRLRGRRPFPHSFALSDRHLTPP